MWAFNSYPILVQGHHAPKELPAASMRSARLVGLTIQIIYTKLEARTSETNSLVSLEMNDGELNFSLLI